ncbi:MAG: hypothetical protein WCK95_17290 [Alphaproteobacteria bacterium]|jgi:hypothetical protein
MTRARTLIWLIALAAFVVPSFGVAAASHAMTPDVVVEAQAALVDCPDHTPPPKPCPEQGTAKHAASQCCPLMSGSVALLPSTAAEQASSRVAPLHLALAHRLRGLTFTQDPPPPRV